MFPLVARRDYCDVITLWKISTKYERSEELEAKSGSSEVSTYPRRRERLNVLCLITPVLLECRNMEVEAGFFEEIRALRAEHTCLSQSER